MPTNCTLFDENGYRRIDWIEKAFGECIHSPLEQASFWIGLSSIGFWLCANGPQIYANYKNSSTKSLHLAFLIQWILGDSANLIGAVLTGQLATQIATAIYYMIMDCILVTQYIYYTIRDRRLARKTIDDKKKMEESQSLLRSALWIVVLLLMFALICHSFAPGITTSNRRATSSSSSSSSLTMRTSSSVQQSLHRGRKLLSFDESGSSSSSSSQQEHSWWDNQYSLSSYSDEPGPKKDEGWPLEGAQDIVGYSIGCVSTVLYLGSRCPQIFKNFQRKSTEGLSLLLFLCAFLGNFTYSLSIFLFSRSPNFILGKLPWIIGSAGVLVLDFTILMQFLFFKVILKTEGKNVDKDEEAVVASGKYDTVKTGTTGKDLYVSQVADGLINEND